MAITSKPYLSLSEKAWEVFNFLEVNYFKKNATPDVHMTPKTIETLLSNPETLMQLCQNWMADRLKIKQLQQRVEALAETNEFLDRKVGGLTEENDAMRASF